MRGDTAAFTALTGHTWVEPKIPVFGVHSETTLPNIYNGLERDFAEDSRNWKTSNNLTRAIRTQRVDAIADEYICTIHHDYSGCTASTPIKILAHLTDYYAAMSQESLREIYDRFRPEWDPTTTSNPTTNWLRSATASPLYPMNKPNNKSSPTYSTSYTTRVCTTIVVMIGATSPPLS